MSNRIINHPSYYNTSCFEVIDFIELFNFNFCLGNSIKYISRAGKKTNDIIEDLEKAKWYLERERDYYNLTIPERKKTIFKEFPIEHALKIAELFCKGQCFLESDENELTNAIFYIVRACYCSFEDRVENYSYAIRKLEQAIELCK